MNRRIPEFHLRVIALYMLILLPLSAYSQQSSTLFLMHDVPQSNLLNPAVQLNCKLFIGIPMLGTTHLSFSNPAFTATSVLTEGELDIDQFYSDLGRLNMISAELALYPLMLGYRHENSYFTFSIAERIASFNTFPRELLGLGLYGNRQYVGETARLGNTRLNLNYYREYSAGWSYVWDRFTTFGAKAKLLFGKAGLFTGSSNLRLATDADTYDLSVNGNASIHSSFPLILNQDANGIITNISVPQLDYVGMLLNRRNPGLALDLGVIHQYNENITLSGAILDAGVIYWTDETNSVRSDIDFTYRGFVIGDNFSPATFFSELMDSLSQDALYEISNDAFLRLLPMQILLGATYQWKENVSFGLASRNLFVNRRIHPSVTASVNTELIDRFSLSLSWSWLDRSFANVGAGLAYTGRGMQVYLVSDNVAGLIWPLNTHTLNFRFGMNLMLGCRNRERDSDGNPNYSNSMPMGKCNWVEGARKKKMPRKF